MSVKVALVSGGAGGIGAAVAHRLAASGHIVGVADLDIGAVTSVVASMPSTMSHIPIELDVSKFASVDEAFARLEKEAGPVNVLVISSAISPAQPGGGLLSIRETEPELWDRVMAVNATGTYYLTRRYLKGCHRIPRGTGRVITMASAAAQLGGYRSNAAYIASKSAVIGYTKALARELAPLGHTANCVSPGLIDTPMLRATVHPAQSDSAAGAVPLARFGSPDEVAATIAFIATAEAAYITGATVDVNGGYHMA